MKHTITYALVAIAVLSALQSVTGQDMTSQPRRPSTYAVRNVAALPLPTYQPIPQVGRALVGITLAIKFTVNKRGRVEKARLAQPLFNYSDPEAMTFASQMRDSVAKWKFRPALNADAQPMAVDVVMPVQVLGKSNKTSVVASIVLDTSKDDRS